MSRHDTSLPKTYFETLYASDQDPWRFATSEYERDKYAATLESLPRGRYRSCLEIGCSIGVLTQRLASRADAILAVDIAALALDQAKDRCASLSNIRFEQACVPGTWPAGNYDLIILSEVIYYLDKADLRLLVGRIRDTIEPEGDIVLVHWLGETDYPLSGDEAVALFIEEAGSFATVHAQSRTDRYRLDVLRSKSQA